METIAFCFKGKKKNHIAANWISFYKSADLVVFLAINKGKTDKWWGKQRS